MTRGWWIAYWLVLGLPTFCFAVVIFIDGTAICSLDPYQTVTCPAALIYILPYAALGLVAAIPFAVIGGIWLLLTLAIKWVGRSNA